MEQDKYLSVEALTKYIEKKFEVDPYLKNIYVKGEISNFKQPISGHMYFTLKDEGAELRCVMFQKSAAKLGFKPEDGMQILLTGRVSVFSKGGRYQLYAEWMEPDGIGSLYIKLEQLKKQLELEGLFAQNRKRALPSFPAKVGIVTSKTGAAIRDMITTIKRRMPSTEILLFPTIVQGDTAAPNIVRNIERANFRNDIDVLIIGRGGGSIEDLWAFNEEIVVRAVADSDIPIISAVGHETDTTLTDYVADVRAATPTAAAELAVPDYRDLLERLAERRFRLIQAMKQRVDVSKQNILRQQERLLMHGPKRQIEQYQERTDYFIERLERGLKQHLILNQHAFEQLTFRLTHTGLDREIMQQQQFLANVSKDLTQQMKQLIIMKRRDFLQKVEALELLSPLGLLKRGYSVVYKDDEILASSASVTIGDEIGITMADGKIRAKITEKGGT
ncbi:exodeoxyribonuclease VII large subunit [Paenilisteria rocourtiae]|uniref:Exodeoxyribonuclease 7 large subunit n=1 Tax=Listeria rocourtiae TaxID=647910 RepID=A0A4R6ZNK4_9LIST|nr:exodeoxyribonuclease VII large subunit [Listeria rocourtiae]EUJ51201.1 exodeoxyribonuclease VII large subunit [Listeria rocourtiae FSL F6-920]MBC1434198.1 exodeoxyribonuclease VII large subunit [Listeria rocourtiae]MBC1603723.1 exodeoxyribonuclease VII large subunit [Listeria rocourtiae]TDR54083.1 exodeoxyribonuclease VII large subunit [Listeria rocourtiae]